MDIGALGTSRWSPPACEVFLIIPKFLDLRFRGLRGEFQWDAITR